MPDTATETPVEQPKFDSSKFIADRNAADKARVSGKEPPAVAKPAEPKVEAKPAEVKEPEPTLEEMQPKLPRSVRREINRLREQVGEFKGMLAAYERFGVKPPAEETKPTEPDPEPARANFASDAEYQRALGRWDARQEAAKLLEGDKKKTGSEAEMEQYRAHLQAMDEKATADIKLIPDWEAAMEAGMGEDAIEFKPDDHMQLMAMIGGSDLKAFVLYHFAKHQDELEHMLELTKKPAEQIKAFHRLEGRIEKLYTPEVKPAQGSEKSQEDRNNPAEDASAPGRTAADRDVRKPKPTGEVVARGGSAPPGEPAIGSKEWMAMRNRAQYAR